MKPRATRMALRRDGTSYATILRTIQGALALASAKVVMASVSSSSQARRPAIWTMTGTPVSRIPTGASTGAPPGAAVAARGGAAWAVGLATVGQSLSVKITVPWGPAHFCMSAKADVDRIRDSSARRLFMGGG